MDLSDGRVLLSHLGMSGRYTLFSSNETAAVKPLLATVNGVFPFHRSVKPRVTTENTTISNSFSPTVPEPFTPTRGVLVSLICSTAHRKLNSRCLQALVPNL